MSDPHAHTVEEALTLLGAKALTEEKLAREVLALRARVAELEAQAEPAAAAPEAGTL